jgi:membrane-associated phospholipid phosphatase
MQLLFQAIPHRGRTDTLFDFLTSDSLVSCWVFAAAFYLFWSMDDGRMAWRRGRLLQIVAAFAIVLVISFLVRPWISWPAPALDPAFRELYPTAFWKNGSADSFPSHSTLAYFTVSAGFWPLSRRLSLLLTAAVLGLISLPRIYVGGHYPIDVLASLLLVVLVLPLVWLWRIPQPVSNWLTSGGAGSRLRELLLILWVFELGEGFKGSTYILATMCHCLVR